MLQQEKASSFATLLYSLLRNRLQRIALHALIFSYNNMFMVNEKKKKKV